MFRNSKSTKFFITPKMVEMAINAICGVISDLKNNNYNLKLDKKMIK